MVCAVSDWEHYLFLLDLKPLNLELEYLGAGCNINHRSLTQLWLDKVSFK